MAWHHLLFFFHFLDFIFQLFIQPQFLFLFILLLSPSLLFSTMRFSRSTHSPIHFNFQHATYPSFLFRTYYFTFPYNIYSYITSNSACYALIVSMNLFISSCVLLASSLPCSVLLHNIPLLPLPVIFLTSLPDIFPSPYLTLPYATLILPFHPSLSHLILRHITSHQYFSLHYSILLPALFSWTSLHPLSYLTLPYLTLLYFILPHLILPYLTLSYLTFPLSFLSISYLILHPLTLSYLIQPI